MNVSWYMSMDMDMEGVLLNPQRQYPNGLPEFVRFAERKS